MTTPTPNTPLTAEDVTLLKAGDVLHGEWDNSTWVFERLTISPGRIVAKRPANGDLARDSIDAFTFIGRPDPDGWIAAPEGGWKEPPLTGCQVDVRSCWYPDDIITDCNPDNAHWPDIIAFRLASLSPAASEPGGESGAVLAEMNELRVLLDSLRAEDDGYRVQGDDDLPLRVLRRLFAALSSSPPAQAGAVAPITQNELAALPIDLAPRDGTFLRLRVRYDPASDKSWTPLDDAELSWTIGFNNLDNTGEDRWQVVGWDWSQDFLLEAVDAEVIGWLPFHGELSTSAHPSGLAGAVVLKGVGRIDGDGWKDTTTKGEEVFVWNAELPSPYAPGQFPRIGNEHWTASTSQYDFTPATVEEVRAIFPKAGAALEPEVSDADILRDTVPADLLDAEMRRLGVTK